MNRARPAALPTLGILAACLALPACGIGGSAAAGGGGIVASGTFVIDNIDPGSTAGGAAGKELAGEQIYGRLLRPDAKGALVPDLASSWKPGADAASWEFTLRAGLKFSDGSALDATDVVATFDRAMKCRAR